MLVTNSTNVVSRCYRIVGVPRGWNFLLCYKNFITNRTVRTFRQACFRTGGSLPFVCNHCVPCGGNFLLRYKDCSTNRTLDTVGESRFGAGSGFAGDCFLGVFDKRQRNRYFAVHGCVHCVARYRAGGLCCVFNCPCCRVGKCGNIHCFAVRATVVGAGMCCSTDRFQSGIGNDCPISIRVPQSIDRVATVFRCSAQCAVTHFSALFRAGGRFYKPIAPLVHKNGAGNVFPVNFHHVFANFYKILFAQCAGVMFQPAFLRA